MNILEYNKVKNLDYLSYCDYLKQKYGYVPYKYGNKKNRPGKEGLFIHHIDENKVSSLCTKENQDIYPQFQESDRLVYADYLEHALLHIMIGEETAGSRNLGLHGANLHIIPGLRSCYENDKINNPKWPSIYYDLVRNDKEVYDLIFERYNKTVEQCDIVIDHNVTLYKQVERCLDDSNKALVVLGTGLGKTTTALQYLWKHQCRALVIGPNNLIKGRKPEKEDRGSGWESYGEWVDVTTYQAFANTYETIDYSQYGLVVIDEAHHAGYDVETDKGAAVWAKGIEYIINHNIKLLGLTATPIRSDGINIGETIFKGCVCEGRAIEDAIEEGIVHPFSYVTAIYDTTGLVEQVKNMYDDSSEECKKLFGQLDLAINNTLTLKEILLKYMPTDQKRKGIIFIQEIADKEYVQNIFKSVYPNIEYRAIDSKMDPKEVEDNRNWFENTDEGYLLAVNMISEGAHYKGVNTLIMFRRTESYLVYTQQIGRIITLTKDEDPHAIVFDLVNNVENIRYNDRKLNKKKSNISEVTKIIRALQDLKSEQIIIADETRNIVNCIKNIKKYANNFWTEDEISILKVCSTIAEARTKINRPVSSIYSKAYELGIKLETPNLFTAQQIEAMKHCTTLDEACNKIQVKEDTKGNRRAIDHKARNLGITLQNYKNKKWTNETTKIAAQAHNAEEAAKMTGFCRSVVLQKKKEYGFNFLPSTSKDNSVQVVRYATQEINTANYFINTYNIPKCSFYKMLKDPTRTVIINGEEEHFCFLTDLDKFEPLSKKPHHAAKAVRCKYDHTEYESSYEASRQIKAKYGVDVRGEKIAKCCKGKCLRAGTLLDGTPLEWEYVDEK